MEEQSVRKVKHEFEEAHSGAFAFVHGLKSREVVVAARVVNGKPKPLVSTQFQNEDIVIVTPNNGEFEKGDTLFAIG